MRRRVSAAAITDPAASSSSSPCRPRMDGSAPVPSPANAALPSVDRAALLAGVSYTHFTPVPPALLSAAPGSSAPPVCVLGIDEAGRGPVLGPMVYAAFFLPEARADALLAVGGTDAAARFADSKTLTPAAREALMRTLCDPAGALHAACSWAVAALSARDISAGMLRPVATHNLNAQALDATIDLIRGVLDRGVNVRHVYVDTVGPPATYQAKLQRLFPSASVTVAKKADSLYPCVSAASVCAKVTRDAALDVLYRALPPAAADVHADAHAPAAWGSGYPSDSRCVAWIKANMHPVFGWGPECRFSWGTAKDMLEAKDSAAVAVDWSSLDDGKPSRMTDYLLSAARDDKPSGELATWYGMPTGLDAF